MSIEQVKKPVQKFQLQEAGNSFFSRAFQILTQAAFDVFELMGPKGNLDLVSKLSPKERAVAEFKLSTISPDDGKYVQEDINNYLSSRAEWEACAYIQLILLETRRDMGLASDKNVQELKNAIEKFDPLNASLIEKQVTKHDQLAVIEELGRHISEETKALLHPGTTSYDILDTARSWILKKAYEEQLWPVISKTIESLIRLAEQLLESNDDGKIRALQVGRTHVQDTSPVPFAATLAGYARRLAERLEKCDSAFSSLKGKISGIVGTQASVCMVIGEDKALEFEKLVLSKLGLEPDYTATQIVQKEQLGDVGHFLVSISKVLGDFAEDMRLLYSTAIGEVTSLDAAARLGGSSADAGKNNPIDWENISGKDVVVESGMVILYNMIKSNFQRDLRGSVQARYQPGQMMAEVFEMFSRADKALKTLWINESKMSENLKKIRENPSEALVAILKGEKGWVHSIYGVGHDFVKEMAKKAKKENKNLMEVCFEDEEFTTLFKSLSDLKQVILKGELEQYIGTSLWRAKDNIAFSGGVISKKFGKIINVKK